VALTVYLNDAASETITRIQTVILPVSQSTLSRKLRNSQSNAMIVALALAEEAITRLSLADLAQITSKTSPQEIAIAVFQAIENPHKTH